MENGFVSTREAAAQLKVTDRWVRGLIRKGYLTGRKFGRDWWVTPESLAVYIHWRDFWKDKKAGGE